VDNRETIRQLISEHLARIPTQQIGRIVTYFKNTNTADVAVFDPQRTGTVVLTNVPFIPSPYGRGFSIPPQTGDTVQVLPAGGSGLHPVIVHWDPQARPEAGPGVSSLESSLL
jgi:hypothetical protein